jgi:soluble lytic murein transglycosylase-like protein
VTEKELFDRQTNLRLGFRFLHDLLVRFDHDLHLALLAYNRGPARVVDILSDGGNPANGYSEAVLRGYEPPRSGGTRGRGGRLGHPRRGTLPRHEIALRGELRVRLDDHAARHAELARERARGR